MSFKRFYTSSKDVWEVGQGDYNRRMYRYHLTNFDPLFFMTYDYITIIHFISGIKFKVKKVITEKEIRLRV